MKRGILDTVTESLSPFYLIIFSLISYYLYHFNTNLFIGLVHSKRVDLTEYNKLNRVRNKKFKIIKIILYVSYNSINAPNPVLETELHIVKPFSIPLFSF